MYLPFIRAKQYDLAAISELNGLVYANNNVVPIVEPVASIIQSQYKKLSTLDVPFILVVNPAVGALESLTQNADIVDKLINQTFKGYQNFGLGFIIRQQTTLKQVTQFIANFPNHEHSFIHFGQAEESVKLAKLIESDKNKKFNIFIDGKASLGYINDFSGIDIYDILIRDGFVKQPKNEFYPERDFFYDLHKNYNKALGYDGFGDFTVIGEQFTPGGGPALVVALHLTDLDERGDIIVRHFKSDTTHPLTSTDPGGKFRYALNEMNRYLRTNPALTSDGITEYKALYKSGHYPGLGVPKKLSIMHHIETIFKQL